MELKTLKNKLLVVDSVFSAKELNIMENEIAALRTAIEPTYQGTEVVLYRADLDSLYQDRKKSFILQAIQARMYSEEVLKWVQKIHDLSFVLMNKQHGFKTTLTEFRGDTQYGSHNDTGTTERWSNIFMSWIWYYNPLPEFMRGGELVVEDLDLEVQPINNRLVLLPAYLYHHVNPTTYSKENYYRTTINGFLAV